MGRSLEASERRHFLAVEALANAATPAGRASPERGAYDRPTRNTATDSNRADHKN